MTKNASAVNTSRRATEQYRSTNHGTFLCNDGILHAILIAIDRRKTRASFDLAFCRDGLHPTGHALHARRLAGLEPCVGQALWSAAKQACLDGHCR